MQPISTNSLPLLSISSLDYQHGIPTQHSSDGKELINRKGSMSEQGERIATLEAKVEIMEQTINEIKQELTKIQKTLWQIMGGLALLQTLATLWLKLGNH